LESPLYSVNGDGLDILEYWKSQAVIFPALAAMAKDVLAIPIAGVGVERLFNMARDVITYRRGRLNGETIEAIMMIKFDLLQHQKLGQDYSAAISQDTTEDLFPDEADTDTEDPPYVFIPDDDDTEEGMSPNLFKGD